MWGKSEPTPEGDDDDDSVVMEPAPFGPWNTEPNAQGTYYVKLSWTPRFNEVRVSYDAAPFTGCNTDTTDNYDDEKTLIDVTTDTPLPTTNLHGTVYYEDGVTPLDCAPLNSLRIEVWGEDRPMQTWCP